jgi:hypothetical protein
MQEACARRVEVLMTTAASAAIVIRIRAVNLYKFPLNFFKFSSIFLYHFIIVEFNLPAVAEVPEFKKITMMFQVHGRLGELLS